LRRFHRTAACQILCEVNSDARVEEKERELKMDRYQDLASELKWLWKVETKVFRIVIGALRTVAKGLEKNLKKAGTNVAYLFTHSQPFSGPLGFYDFIRDYPGEPASEG